MGFLLTACDFGSPTCKVEYRLLDDWGSGFSASLSVKNEQEESLTEWELDFPADPQQMILGIENAEIVADTMMTRLRAPEPAVLPPGGTSEILMTVSQTGPRRTPDRFRLNGRVCEGGSVKRVSFLDHLGEIVELLVGQSPAAAHIAPQDRFTFSVGSETAELGFVEIHRGIVRFFATGAPWADLQVEAPGTSRHVRMQKTESGSEYMIFGLRPGALIRYRFLVGLNGQAWTNWREAIYSGLNSQVVTHRVPRARELSDGTLSFEVDGHPWAEVHTQRAGTFLARRLDTTETGHRLIIRDLEPGDQIDYRWTIGIDQSPGQYDTDWSTHIYAGHGDASEAPTPQPDAEPSPNPNPPEETEPDTDPPVENQPAPVDPIDSPPNSDNSDSPPNPDDPPNPDSPPVTPPGAGNQSSESTLYRFETDTLYLVEGASLSDSGRLETESGTSGRFRRVPVGSGSVVYEATELHAQYDPSEGISAFRIWIDGWLTGIAYVQARVLYDFEGDGVTDREELYVAAPAHAQRGLDLYDSEITPLLESSGEYRDLQSGTVRLELFNPHFNGGPDIFSQADARELARSFLEIPFDFEPIEETRTDPEKTQVIFPEGILCPESSTTARCGPTFDTEQPFFTSQEINTAKQRGLAAFRAPGAHGACAGCHVPDAFDLAIIGYSDADIRRRALEHVSPSQAEEIVQLVHAQRQEHALTRILHPAHFRPLQPGFEPLPGNTPQDRDLAFLEFLHDEVGLLLVTDNIDSREKALEAQRQLLALDIHRLRIGVRLDRWSEDGFHGLSHTGQDPLDGSGAIGQNGSVAEWLPNMASRPEDPEDFYQVFDRYAANPTDYNFWPFYDSLAESTRSEEALQSEDEERAFKWMATKYESIQVLAHMLRQQTLEYPDRVIDQLERDIVSNRDIAIARQPIWRVGDLIRQRPLHCDHPDGCTVFPDFVKNEANEDKLELQSRILERAWFWAGWMLDRSLLTSDESFPTVSGDYFYPLHQGHWGGHYAFIVAKMSAEKANADGWGKTVGPGVAGHGKWASIRPFLVYKHSEFQRPMFGEYDPRHELQKRLLTNTARMWLYLVHEDVERTGMAFDRAGTAKAINFARLNWLEGTDPDGPREDIERIFSETVDMLREATELRQQHHTDDLYDYLPVAEVPLD